MEAATNFLVKRGNDALALNPVRTRIPLPAMRSI